VFDTAGGTEKVYDLTDYYQHKAFVADLWDEEDPRWVEGYDKSASPKDTGLTLIYKDDDGVDVVVDHVNMTVVEITVNFLNKDKNEIDNLRVGKWKDGFAGSPPTVKANFIDLDPDRFYVRVDDQTMKGEGKVSINLWTESPGSDYDDDATEVELSETGANSGIFESDSLMLMSDDVDDDHQVDAIADDVENDRTHKVAIEGKVQLQYPASGCGNWKKEADVPEPSDVKTVNVHVVILKNGSTVLIGERFKDENDNGVRDGGETYRDTDSSSSYTSNLSESDATKRVEEEFEVAKQRYAQVGVKLNLTIDFEQAPAAINDGLIELSLTSPDGDNDLSDDEKSLFQAGLNSTSRVDIEAYYVAKATRTQGSDFSRSTACPSDWYENMTTTDLNDSIIVTNKAGYYDPAHELYHIFSQKTAHFGGATNLFDDFCTYIVLESGASPTDSKRLDTTQESTIRNSEYAQ
jgi:hypothetical protein